MAPKTEAHFKPEAVLADEISNPSMIQ